MASRRSYVARHRHGRPGLSHVSAMMSTWPPLRPLRPLRRRWFARRSDPLTGPGVVVAMPSGALLSHRAA